MASPDGAARALGDLYQQAQRELEQLVRAALDRGADGTAAFYRQQLDRVNAILAALQQRAVPLATQLAADAYARGALAVNHALNVSAAIDFAGSHQQAIAVLAGNVAHRLNEAAVTVGRRTDDAFRRVALQRTAVAAATGQARREVSAALERQLVREGVTDATTGFVASNGARWSLDTYAQMVARTTTREAMSAGTAGQMRALGNDLVTISDHGPTDELCAAYAGQTFSLDGSTPGYDVLDDFPPFHPNCLHVMTPAEANFDTFVAAALADDGG